MSLDDNVEDIIGMTILTRTGTRSFRNDNLMQRTKIRVSIVLGRHRQCVYSSIQTPQHHHHNHHKIQSSSPIIQETLQFPIQKVSGGIGGIASIMPPCDDLNNDDERFVYSFSSNELDSPPQIVEHRNVLVATNNRASQELNQRLGVLEKDYVVVEDSVIGLQVKY
ncbi:hypothetical protein AgCh_001275 [Apium graveolens]